MRVVGKTLLGGRVTVRLMLFLPRVAKVKIKTLIYQKPTKRLVHVIVLQVVSQIKIVFRKLPVSSFYEFLQTGIHCDIDPLMKRVFVRPIMTGIFYGTVYNWDLLWD